MASESDFHDSTEAVKVETEEREGMPNERAFDPDRPRGALTYTDRMQLLEGPPDDLSTKARQQRRYRIRTRAKNSVLDYTLLLELDKPDRETIQEIDPTDALAFLMQRYARDIIEAPETKSRASEADKKFYRKYFETALAGSIERSFETEDPDGVYDVNVKIETSRSERPVPTAAEIEDRIQAGTIDPERIRDYYDQGALTLSELTQLTRDGRLLALDELTDDAYEALLEETPDFLDEDD